MVLLIIILIFGLIYIFRHSITLWLINKATRNAQNQFSQMFEQQFGNMGFAADDTPPERKAGWDKPRQRKKKYAATDGEAVSFQEITVEHTETHTADYSSTSTHIEIEQQIVDAEWEDI